ncbi:DUF3889 domain-containing protein [Jeotgalibacillus campisalis]|nr:DUF3889 domain-containing protein [Jeotgalibacillus campisalis]
MRKTIIAIGICTIAISALTPASTTTLAQHQAPTYAKWGSLAVKETQSKYPNAEIIDYLHVGKESKNDTTIEKFKLWLKEGGNEFGVFVNIEYNTETEKVVKIDFQETTR